MSHNSFMNEGICLFDPDEVSNRKEKEAALWCLVNIGSERPKSIVQEVRLYRKHVPVLLKYMDDLVDMCKAARIMDERFEDESANRSNKRWSDAEDNQLIEMVCDDSYKSAIQIATILGRTVPAIKTRISTLVGRKRLSQKVAGRFVGTINGEEVETKIDGTLYKEEQQ